jgi:ribosomal RNA-processing protein 36
MVTIKELASSDSGDSSNEESLNDDVPLSKSTRSRRSNSSSDASDDARNNSDESDATSDEDTDGESDEEEEDDLRHLPLGERLKRQLEKGNGKVRNVPKNHGEKSFHPNAKNGARSSDGALKKKSKHAPTEASSKRRDFFLRQQFHKVGSVAVGTSVDVHAHRYKPRDPREMPADGMGSSSGRPSTIPQHPEDYAFLQEMRTKEIATLQRRLQARQLTGNRGQEQRKRYGIRHDDAEGLQQDQRDLHRLLQEKAAFERQQLDRAAQQAVRENLKAVAGENSTAARKYRPKQRELKRMYMEAKYDLLQEKKGGSATIDQILEKRRKKLKSKHSKMPSVL